MRASSWRCPSFAAAAASRPSSSRGSVRSSARLRRPGGVRRRRLDQEGRPGGRLARAGDLEVGRRKDLPNLGEQVDAFRTRPLEERPLFCEDYELWLPLRRRRLPHRACAWATRDLSRSFRSKEFGRTPRLEGLRATLELVLAEYRLDDGFRSLVEWRVAAIDRQLYGRGHGSRGAARSREAAPKAVPVTPDPREVAAVLEATGGSST
jgi:hypothetical protein